MCVILSIESFISHGEWRLINFLLTSIIMEDNVLHLVGDEIQRVGN